MSLCYSLNIPDRSLRCGRLVCKRAYKHSHCSSVWQRSIGGFIDIPGMLVLACARSCRLALSPSDVYTPTAKLFLRPDEATRKCTIKP